MCEKENKLNNYNVWNEIKKGNILQMGQRAKYYMHLKICAFKQYSDYNTYNNVFNLEVVPSVIRPGKRNIFGLKHKRATGR